MSVVEQFFADCRQNVARLANDSAVRALSKDWVRETSRHKYSYNFTWLGRPIIQLPQDILAMQEIIWRVKPRLIIETGIAHGGSLVFYASMLEMLGNDGLVVGIDVDIRDHNRQEIEGHPMFKRIRMLEGSSIDPSMIAQVTNMFDGREPVLVVLDSNHTHDHVLAELQAYSPLVTPGSYLVVFDTAVEDLPAGSFPDRPWDKGNNPKTAVHAFLRQNRRFEIDQELEAKLLLTTAPDGYLRCVA